jgi:PAS domain S-box/diguanylate cyclase (GGDEF) domain
MVLLSVSSFLAAILYFIIGFNTIRLNRESKLCKYFFYLTVSMTIWSFADGFLYLAKNIYEYYFWNKIAAFGWCSFEALVLYFVMLLTENKQVKHWYMKLLILFPAPFFTAMVLFKFGPDANTSQFTQTFFYTGNFLYNFTYLLISILLIYLWGRNSTSKIQKKQANIIVICSVIPFLLNLLFQDILPALHIVKIPYIGQLFSLIMLCGVYHAINKYQFMSIPTSQITNELFNEFTGIALLTDSKGFIMKANHQVYSLLEYKEKEVIGNSLTSIIRSQKLEQIFEEYETRPEKIKLLNMDIPIQSGTMITFNITIIPLLTSSNLLRGIFLVGEDIRITRWLQDEIQRHKLTNEKLQNSETLFRKLLEVTPISIVFVSKLTRRIVYLNAQAVELFQIDGVELSDIHISDYFVNREDISFLDKCFQQNNKISKNETHLKRNDKSIFSALVTVISSIYHEEEVALCCVVDMTEQKNIEEMLKKNNEYITKLNEELTEMNTNLVNKSTRDGLTNLYNHQYMNEILETKLQEVSVTKENLCLMMMDIDHFKNVNDEYGHQIGDKVLAVIADLILQNTRSSDYIGRYGGEEFIVILTDTDIDLAIHIAEKIRTSIQDYNFKIKGLKVTISIGVTQYQGELSNVLINKADMLLYQAKNNGRNRVERN